MSEQQSVRALYMEQNDLLSHKASVTKMGFGEINKKRYQWCQLNETIFHPKGGGQPSDEGTVAGIPVVYVHKELFDKSRLDQFQILHCFEENQTLPFTEKSLVELSVDASKRMLHSQLHTGGHLVAEAVQTQFPSLQAYQGNHYPADAYVKFKMTSSSIDYEKEEIRSKAQEQIVLWVNEDRPVVSQMLPSGMRAVKITQELAPCGGTHVTSTKAVHTLQIIDVSINKKDGTITVKYRV